MRAVTCGSWPWTNCLELKIVLFDYEVVVFL
jgi:hypothetical protein